MNYYLDTSALVKRYVYEPGSVFVRSLTLDIDANIVVISNITIAEIYSTLARRKREGSVTALDHDFFANEFDYHCTFQYHLIEINSDILAFTRYLLNRHVLRAYDAIQLATAYLVNQDLIAVGIPSVTFLSADTRLLTAADAEGLLVDNPNNYP